MAAKETILTRQGREELVRELSEREGVRNDEIIESLKEARGFGDLSENAEFDAAKEEQARNAARINEIRQILATARVVDDDDPEAIASAMSVSIGSIVEIRDENGKLSEYTIVGTTETNSLQHRISNESPAGSAMIGHVAGETIQFVTPTGKVRTYTITNIRR